MSFIAALLTLLFFCHPALFIVGLVIVLMVVLATCCPVAFWFLLVGGIISAICEAK